MVHKFEDALNDCLEKMAEGEAIERCVERYPHQYREELLSLLKAAQTTFNAIGSISYRVETKQRGMARMMEAYSEGRMDGRRRWFSIPFLQPLARPILVGFAAVFLVAVAAGGSTMAATDSVPGEPLYWVKKTRENVYLMMPGSNIEKAEAHARLANRRTQEIDTLIERNRILEAERLTRLVQYHLNKTALYAGVVLFADPYEMPVPSKQHNMTDLRKALERDAQILRIRLGHQAERAPVTRRGKIVRIMQQSDLDYRIVIHAMNEDERLFWRNQSARAGVR